MSISFCLDLQEKYAPPLAAKPCDEGLFFKGTRDSILILIHGLTGTPNEMLYIAKSFHRKGYSVLCPKLANHGRALKILQKTTWQECFESVRTAYNSIKGRYRHVFVSGLSMGALLSLLLADEFASSITGVGCLSPTLFYDGWNTPWYKCFLPLLCMTPLKNCVYVKEEPPYGIKNEDLRRRVHEYYRSADIHDTRNVALYGYPYFPVSLLHQLNLLVKYTTSRLERITTPVQLIQATHDDMTSIKNSQFIYSRLSSNIKEVVLLDNCYHVITADQERSTVAQKLESFFSSLQSKDAQ